jgi:hypothetical protein
MMKKRTSPVAIALVGVVLFAPMKVLADSVYFATPSVLQLTIKKFELCADATCSSPVILGSGDATFDIASGGAGASIGDYTANASIPRGVRYPYARITMSRIFTVKGAANVPNVGVGAPANMAAAACYTNTANPNTGDAEIEIGTDNQATNLTAALVAASPQAIKLAEGPPPENDTLISEVYTENDNIAVYSLSSAIYLDPNSASPEISISIDATNAMSFSSDGADCIADEEPPGISISVS